MMNFHSAMIPMYRVPGDPARKTNQKLRKSNREKVGTMSKVVGGICTIDSVSPTKMACAGCGAKVPRPEFKDEITAFYNWADESEKRFE
ncbi:phage integrase [Paenibacillus alvei A6-6i-x]|nr:phage integrase [Paenibacillus alvei A6-6i-x]